jgi:hypothetical protein
VTSQNTVKYLAIGMPLGITMTGDPAIYSVRLGSGYIYMSEETYRVWLSALNGIDSDEFESILHSAAEKDDYAETLEWFIESNLIIPWALAGTGFSDYAKIRVSPCGTGTGEDPNSPGMFNIEDRSGTIDALQVDFVAYMLWSNCNGLRSLSDACQATADYLGVGVGRKIISVRILPAVNF